jgi:hypothetical protein
MWGDLDAQPPRRAKTGVMQWAWKLVDLLGVEGPLRIENPPEREDQLESEEPARIEGLPMGAPEQAGQGGRPRWIRRLPPVMLGSGLLE